MKMERGEIKRREFLKLAAWVAAGGGGVFLAHGRVGVAAENRVGFAAPHGAFPVQGDDRWLAIRIVHTMADDEAGRDEV